MTDDRFALLADRRAIIDRRLLMDQLEGEVVTVSGDDARRQLLVSRLKVALEQGREEIAARLTASPSRGRTAALGGAFLVDQLVRVAYDVIVDHIYPSANRSAGERLAVMAAGGYGRAEMAPFSDVDIGLVTPFKLTSWTEQVVESLLYTLWDLGLKVGHSTRSLDEMIRAAQGDLTVRTSLLEARFIWGDRALYDTAQARFHAEVVAGNARDFVAAKLNERDERHRRMGDSRYVVEPNVKEGKGGLRDLQTLYWIGKFIHQVRFAAELVDAGLFTRSEYRQFKRAENFLLAVRCHLHLLAGRAEERLTFDMQREVAARMRFSDRPGKSAVERCMQLYFLHAKTVGDLTGTFLAHLDDQRAARGRRYLPTIRRRPRRLAGFVLDRGRLALPHDGFFSEDPVRLMEVFALADQHKLEIHPQAVRQARSDAKLVDHDLRHTPRANALFLDVLTSPRDPETVLRWMNEAGIFGRFIPDFGRVVGQMQFDMYHHYTVDEHSIRAIGLLAQIESGALHEDHPLSTAIIGHVVSRRLLYVAVLMHDIAKGRGGDHSVLGAELALRVCPRLGLNKAETETVAWLVRHHLLMSATAFKRDLADFKTILDFVEVIKSPERLKLLLLLTVVDIRAVGPGVWNGWKRQLLTTLFESAEEVLRLGHKQRGREARITEKHSAAAALSSLPKAQFDRLAGELPASYWIAEPAAVIAANLAHVAGAGGALLHVAAIPDPDRGATLVMVLAADHPGLFYRIAGGIHLAGGNIIDARIHTTRTGMALDNFVVQDPLGRPFDEPRQLDRLLGAIGDALANRVKLLPRLTAKAAAHPRADSFSIAPSALVDNRASNRFTVVEVNAQDRPALLSQLAHALVQSKVMVHSAHVATYGERAVDTFYLTDLTGDKISSPARIKTLEKRLLDAAMSASAEA